MSERLTVRDASVSDIPAMHAVRLSVRENRLSDSSRVGEQDYVQFADDQSAWVAESNGRLVGFAAVDKGAARVWALFVDPGAEGLGVGSALHRKMLDWARNSGLARLTLTTGPATRAERFYRENGWTAAGRDGNGEIIFERAP